MKGLFTTWKQNKLENSMKICFLATVFTSFWGSAILSFSVSGIGEVFPFRVLLCVTAVLYLIWCIRGKDHFWKDSSRIEKWCYILIGIMLVYGAVSLLWAIDFMFSFRKLFNLCFDLCFFFLLLRLCREQKIMKSTICLSLIAVGILGVMGLYEISNGGIFSGKYDHGTTFFWFMTIYQFPLTVSSTCNEYAGTFLFVGSVALLYWIANRRGDCSRWELWGVIFAIPAVWFMMLASSARLCQTAFLILLIGFAVYMLLKDRKKFWVPLLAILLVCCVQFAHQYRFIVPPTQKYIVEMEEYRDKVSQAEPGVYIEKPTLELGDERFQSLIDQFFSVDEETGERVLNDDSSAGARTKLLMHAFQCFVESYGLGCGLGNTEQLALERKVAPAPGGEDHYSAIHCFVARIVADYGLFVLIPLCVVGFSLLRRGWRLFVVGRKRKDREAVGISVFYVCCLISFLFVSTASADAQDLLCMWIFLALIVLLSRTIKSINGQNTSEGIVP